MGDLGPRRLWHASPALELLQALLHEHLHALEGNAPGRLGLMQELRAPRLVRGVQHHDGGAARKEPRRELEPDAGWDGADHDVDLG